jgi:hypothetical protein
MASAWSSSRSLVFRLGNIACVSPDGSRCFTTVLAVFLYLLTPGTLIAVPPDFTKEALPFFNKFCVDCHSTEKQEGDFRIDSLSKNVGHEDGPQWAEVLERISSGEMPPQEALNQPTTNESLAIVTWLAARLTEAEAERLAARGRISYNRLTREEYVNTVRDLLGVQFDAADPGAFFDDEEWRGFERLGAVMTLSPSNIEKYLAAAETILAEAYPATQPKLLEFTKRAVTESQIDQSHRQRLSELGLLDKVRYEIWPGDIFRGSGSEPLPEAGIYEISYTLSGLKPENGRAPRLYVYETRLDRVLYEQEVIAPEDQPITVTFRAHLPKGRPNISVINEVPGPSNNPRSGRHGRRPFISTKDGRIPWQIKLTDEQGNPRYPFLILDTVSFRGPIITEQEQQRREEYFHSSVEDLDEIRAGLERLATRAFRRPVRSDEIDRFMSIVKTESEAGEKFDTAVKAGMLAILCSKSFLFLAEGDEDVERNTLNDWEMASRLSYFLWSTMPDDELFRLAEAGKLLDKAERARQVARMLADPRSDRFSDSFATQWLNLRKVGQFSPDKQIYPDYDKHLEMSMIGETRMFFHEVLLGGLTLREFLDSDWSMLNARLADFYGLSPEGLTDRLQKVSLPPASRRGGILTQAAILSLTSDGTRHRPVHRGKWVSEAIFGKVPPPPPANVDPIETNPVDAPKATLRMRLEAHIHDARCASCHAKIDPLGLAFENYDAIGRWRTEEIVEGTGANPPVNSSGKLPDGRSFQSPEEFKQLLLADLDTFNTTFIEKLATYALRRTISFQDQKEIAAIAAQSKNRNYRVRDIVEELVCSELFEKK